MVNKYLLVLVFVAVLVENGVHLTVLSVLTEAGNDYGLSQNVDLISAPLQNSARILNDRTKYSNLELNEDGISTNIDEADETEIDIASEKSLLEPNDERSQANTISTVTTIAVGTQSKLLAVPGSTVQIYFDITNQGTEPSYHTFKVQDEQRYLRELTPRQSYILAGQTIQAIVTCYIPPNAEVGLKDKIVFSSQGSNSASQSVWLTVASTATMQDTSAPSVSYTYGSRCETKTGAGVCAGHIWSLEVTAIDTDTGIMRIQSSPKGILIRNAFTAGTKNAVIASYTASCCQTKVTVTVYDIAGNQRTLNLDVTDIWLNEAGIAAVVLGVLLLLCLIALIVIVCIICIRRRKASRDLPTYRGGGTTSADR